MNAFVPGQSEVDKFGGKCPTRVCPWGSEEVNRVTILHADLAGTAQGMTLGGPFSSASRDHAVLLMLRVLPAASSPGQRVPNARGRTTNLERADHPSRPMVATVSAGKDSLPICLSGDGDDEMAAGQL